MARSNFINALQTGDTFTTNGMVANSTTGSAVLDLFSKIGASRSMAEYDIVSLFKNAFNEDGLLAIKTLFWARDIRGGAGERRAFRIIFRWLCENNPDVALKLIAFIPEYGRYDDMLVAINTPCENGIVNFIKSQLISDCADEGIPYFGKK